MHAHLYRAVLSVAAPLKETAWAHGSAIDVAAAAAAAATVEVVRGPSTSALRMKHASSRVVASFWYRGAGGWAEARRATRSA